MRTKAAISVACSVAIAWSDCDILDYIIIISISITIVNTMRTKAAISAACSVAIAWSDCVRYDYIIITIISITIVNTMRTKSSNVRCVFRVPQNCSLFLHQT